MTYFDKDGHTADLRDDGSLDTVLLVDGSEEVRFSQEYASQYRDSNGALTEDGFITLAEEALDQVVGDI